MNPRFQGGGITFGSDASREKYAQLVEARRSRQKVPYAVAPRNSLKLPNGRVFQEGEEVTAEDLVDVWPNGPPTGAWLDWRGSRLERLLVGTPAHILEKLVSHGYVLSRY